MQYYRIRHSINIKVIGDYPQVVNVLLTTSWEDPNFIESYVAKKAPDNVFLPTPVLYKKSKATDLISAATVGLSLNLLVSHKLKSIIQNFKSCGIQSFDTELLDHKGAPYSYSIMHAFDFGYNLLNYKDSEIGFYTDSVGSELVEKFYFNDNMDFENKIKEYLNYLTNVESIEKYLFIRRISFIENNIIDFFALQYVRGGIGFYVSEKLKVAIEQAGCTGMIFTEANEKYP